MSQFVKRFVLIAGRSIPGLQVSTAETMVVETANGKRIPSQFADILTLRETNPDLGPVETYLTVTHENLRFSPLRFNTVPGLDYDPETGALLTIEELETRRMADIAKRQLANAERRAPKVLALDLDAAESENAPAS